MSGGEGVVSFTGMLTPPDIIHPLFVKNVRGDKCLPFFVELVSKCGSVVILQSPHISSWPYLTEHMSLKIFCRNLS